MMCRRTISVAAMLALQLATGPAAALQRVYVANISGGTVAVVDADRRAVIGSIAVGRQPDGIAASRDGRTVWVANFADATVSVIDTASDAVVATIPVDLGPVGIAVSPSGGEVYVACKVARTLVVIDTASRAVAASIGIGQGPNDVAVAPDGSRVFVTRSEGDTVAVLDTATRRQVDLLQVGRSPNRLALSADGSQLYVTLFRDSQVVRITLAGAEPVRDYTGTRPSGIALSADGRSLYVSSQEHELRRLDPLTLETLDVACAGVAPYGLLALTGGPLLIADMGGDVVRVLGAGAAEIAVDGGPFALAALPREAPVLDLAIDSPAAGTRPEAGSALPVRISAGDGSSSLTRWTLRLIGDDGAPGQVLLATGTEPVSSAVVATIDAGTLLAGHTYRLSLEGVGVENSHVVRTTPLFVPDRQFALVPLESTRGDPYSTGAMMDGSGQKFARFEPDRLDVAVYDAATGQVHYFVPPLPFLGEVLQLSRDGTRVVLTVRVDTLLSFGLVDLTKSSFSLVDVAPPFDLDADGRQAATVRYTRGGWNYSLTDLDTGSVVAITDQPTLEDLPPTCRPFAVGQPRLSADGTVVAFATTLLLGGPPGCNLYVYDVASGSTRFVHAFGDAGPVAPPSMDDDGGRLAVVLPPLDAEADAPRRLQLIDLADGAVTPLLTDSAAGVLDGVLSGDGASVIFSSCADIDPRVGNPDYSQELFRLDLTSGEVTQITATRGGPQDCFTRGGEPLSPQVSHGADVVAFRGQGFGPLYCGNPGPQRDEHTGLAFGQARAVRIAADNRPPTLDVPETAVTAINQLLDITAHTVDVDGDVPLYFAEFDDLGGLPPGAALFDQEEQGQARFVWSPSATDVGDHVLRLGAFDGRGGDVVRSVHVSVCRFLSIDPIGDVVTAIFGSQPVACGSGDANHDGVASAADLLVRR